MKGSLKAQPWVDVGDRYAAQVNAAGTVAFLTDKLNPKASFAFTKDAVCDLAKILGLVPITEASARAIVDAASERARGMVFKRCLRHGIELIDFMQNGGCYGPHPGDHVTVAEQADCPECRRR